MKKGGKKKAERKTSEISTGCDDGLCSGEICEYKESGRGKQMSRQSPSLRLLLRARDFSLDPASRVKRKTNKKPLKNCTAARYNFNWLTNMYVFINRLTFRRHPWLGSSPRRCNGRSVPVRIKMRHKLVFIHIHFSDILFKSSSVTVCRVSL